MLGNMDGWSWWRRSSIHEAKKKNSREKRLKLALPMYVVVLSKFDGDTVGDVEFWLRVEI